tara:strand:- start:1723 stop:2676 length:954 start_codon:yes stop_codon:yes gene_type:complete
MGIRYLNNYFYSNCKKGIYNINIDQLSNKKIAIDASIYMYNYKVKGDLIEYMYKMIFIFRSHSIHPVFIFDGKPPPEKNQILKERREKKREAFENINILTTKMKQCIENSKKYNTIQQQILNLKKRTIRLTMEDINNVKKLLKLCGITYYEADGEADSLCAKLVTKNIVWACMSDDMDLFIYGCPRVIRKYNIFTGRALLYNSKELLTELNMNSNTFKEICVVSGTDYNNNNNNNIYKTLKYYNEYINDKKGNDFYGWLDKNTNYIEDYHKLCLCYLLFDLNNYNIKKYYNIKIHNTPVNTYELCRYLKNYNFIFIE